MQKEDSSSTRRFLILHFAFLILALALRLPGLTWGLPNAEHWYSYHPDERQIALAVSNVANDFNPHFFNYPSLFIYLTYFAYLIQTILGFGTPPNGTPWPPLHDVILSGRIVCALLGAATIPAVFLIGQRIAGLSPSSKRASESPSLEEGVSPARWPLCAAFLMAALPGHVQHSHFATVDVPATFFVVWSLFFALKALTPPAQRAPASPQTAGRGETSALLISAFLAGLAAATKYNAGLVVIAPLCALWFGGFDKQILRTLGAIIVATVAFVLGCPFSVLSPQEFLGNRTDSGLLYELLVHPRQGQGDIFLNTGNGWLYHLTFNLPFALTAPLTIAAIAGLFVVVRSKNKLWLPLLAFAGLYFLTLGLSQVRFMRYNLPLVPVLCLAAAFALTALPRGAKNFVAGALSLLVFIGATNVLYPFCVPDPRDQAAAYLKSKVTKPVTIALINQPWFYTPPLWPQDYPPPQKVKSGVSPDGRFKFGVVGLDHNKALEMSRGGLFVANEFEYREEQRIRVYGYSAELIDWYSDASSGNLPFPLVPQRFKNQTPLELPGRKFVPHDFLYTNPEQWVLSN